MTAQRSPRPRPGSQIAGRARALVVPIKAFADAKGRLAERFAPQERQALAVAMADRVLAAAGSLEVFVVADDPEVVRWATAGGARVVDPGEPGLSRAVSVGVAAARRAGHDRVVVSHGDLPLADDLDRIDRHADVVLVTDRHGDGTNVVALRTDVGFRFAYGAGSRHRHVAEAHRLDQSVRVVTRSGLCWDVDVPDDIAGPVADLLARTIDEAAHG
ncbi:MAG: 2-phospho-L-lactate guanylyltransferase [Actinomycetota bacterium]